MPARCSTKAIPIRPFCWALKMSPRKRALEREREDLLRKQQTLLAREGCAARRTGAHRVGKLLQRLPPSSTKSRMVTSEETRLHLQDAHKRVMSIAACSKTPPCYRDRREPVEWRLTKCSRARAAQMSMIGDYRPAALKVTSDAALVTWREAISLGLIVTELRPKTRSKTPSR